MPKLPKTRIPKPIDARTHGFIDYAHAAFFLGFALLTRKSNPRAAIAAAGTGAFVLVQSLLTDYPLGAAPVMSFETHGKLDAAFAAGSWAVPHIFGFAGTPAARIFEGNTLVEGSVVALTDFNNTRAKLG